MPRVPALQWGIMNELVAREAYFNALKGEHDSFQVKCTGLHVHPNYPHLGASPDGLVSCSCCGMGLLEIKYPYSKRDVDPRQVNDAHFYLERTAAGLLLRRYHDYFKQVQGQLAICERS